MHLFHGTYVEFDKIELCKSQRGKDFGQGFYLSENYQQAYEMALFKSMQFEGQPIVLEYEFDPTLLTDGTLNFKRFDSYSKEWAEFVLQNRTNGSTNNIHDFDVVYGPIANDKIGVQIRNLLENNIDIHTFLERLKYIKGITFQYFFGSELAISKLTRI